MGRTTSTTALLASVLVIALAGGLVALDKLPAEAFMALVAAAGLGGAAVARQRSRRRKRQSEPASKRDPAIAPPVARYRAPTRRPGDLEVGE